MFFSIITHIVLNVICDIGDHNAIIISSVLVVLAIFMVSGGYLIFRHWRLSRDMDTLLWRIDKRDIHWENGQFFPINRGSQASLAKFSTVFAPLVTYRERIFAAKAMDTDFLDSNMKHQLKLVRSILVSLFLTDCKSE